MILSTSNYEDAIEWLEEAEDRVELITEARIRDKPAHVLGDKCIIENALKQLRKALVGE
jgi:hypothetical protein